MGPDGNSYLYIARRVRSSNPVHARADAVLVAGRHIAAVGSADELRRRAPTATVREFPGATLTPGFTDAHVHVVEWAFARRMADLADAHSPEACARAVAEHATDTHGDWLRGVGWNAHLWGGGYPHRDVLDAVAPERPVALQSHDMHALWVNGVALERAGITRDTADPADGRIVRDADGEPTGVLLEHATALVVDLIPKLDDDAILDAVRAAQEALHALGLTGVHSFPGIHVTRPEPLALFGAMRERGELRLRVLQHLALDRLDDAIALGLRSGFGDDLLRIGAIKMFLDGALGSRTAWMREAYEDSADCGLCTLAPAEFSAHVRRAARHGLATTVHAIGDAAVCAALDGLTSADVAGPALPHRIEHVQCCPPERLADAGRAGIVCSVQPAHLMSDWRAVDRHWGTQRAPGSYAFRSLAAGGAVLAFGSDAPVEPVDPRLGLFAAVERSDRQRLPAGGWQPQERLERAAAIRAYTYGPAFAAGMADRLGVLAPGALADIVAWNADPFACSAPELLELRCLATIVDGAPVWSSSQ